MTVASCDAWLARRRRGVVLTLVAAATLVRAIYCAQLASSAGGEGPLIWLHRWDQSDMHFYDRWARVIAAGDVLTDRSLHPQHDWHLAVAGDYMARHGQQEGSEASPRQRAAELWDRWYGGKRFHQHPLYPYLIALTYTIGGPNVGWVFLWQLLLGIGTVVLAYRIGRRLAGDTAGVIAAALVIGSGPLLMYELALLRHTLVTFLGLAAVEAALVAGEPDHSRPRRGAALLCGALGGACVLAQGGMGLLVAAMVATVGGRAGRARSAGLLAALWVVIGVGIVLAPAIARNLLVGVGPLQLSSVGEATFVATNGPLQHDDLTFYASAAIPEAIERARAGGPGVVVQTIRMHESVGDWLALLGRKEAMAWRWLEKPNNVSFAYYAQHAPVLAALPVRFPLVVALAAAGLVVAPWRRLTWPLVAAWLPLVVLVAIGLASSIIVAPHARYRVAVVAWAAPLAGAAAVAMARAWKNARPRAAGAAGVAMVLWGVSLRPVPEAVKAISVADWLSPYEAYWLPAQEEAVAEGDWERAATVIERSLIVRPPLLDQGSRHRPAADDQQRDLARFYAAIYARLAEALRNSGQLQQALVAERRSMDLAEAATAPPP